MWKVLVVLIAAALAWVAPSDCLADGKVFATMHHAALIPDQQAMIAWNDGVQTLAIETRFDGTGRRFAWVIPVPAVPSIEPATTGLFPTLRVIGAPKLARVGNGAMHFAVLALLAYLILRASDSESRRSWMIITSALIGLTVFVLLILVPSLGSARGSPAFTAGLTVVDRKVVGSYETTTISGDSADPVIAWLTANGFAAPEASRPVIADYAAKGWCFVACKLTREAESGVATPHPLVFTFPVERPVYPLRLTATDGRPVTIELTVFGEGTAAAPGFTVQRSFQPEYDDPWLAGYSYRDTTTISHAGVRALAADLPVVTSLRGTLSPARMAQDAVIEFKPFERQQRVIYTRDDAALAALNIAAAVFAAGMWAAVVRSAIVGTCTTAARRRYTNISFICGVCAWGFMVASLPKTNVDSVSPSRPDPQMDDALARVAAESQTIRHQTPEDFEAWARRRIAEIVAETDWPRLTRPREEDSPGNYLLSTGPDGLVIHQYGPVGAEYRRALTSFEPRP